jgi:hypothetical protein
MKKSANIFSDRNSNEDDQGLELDEFSKSSNSEDIESNHEKWKSMNISDSIDDENTKVSNLKILNIANNVR